MIDFELDAGQQQLRDVVRRFTEEEVAPRVVEYNRKGQVPEDLVAQIIDLGLVGGVVPTEYGGSGMDYVTWSICVEELARYCTSLAAIVGYPSSLAGQGLLGWGTEDQKRRFLDPLARGECLAATAITEPEAGSDAAALRTTATRTTGGFLISGQKTWISNANTCRWMMLFATVDREAGRRGITAFLVDRETKGLVTRPLKHKLSNRASDTGEVFLDEVFVEDDRVLGGVGEGWPILLAAVNAGRLHVAARSVGIAQGALDLSVDYARQRRSFGRPIAEHQLVAANLAEMSVQVETARLAVWRAARALDKGEVNANYWPSVAKLHAGRVAMSVAHSAVQLHGAYGLSDEYHVERHFREAKMQEIVDGTNEIQLMIIARERLKKRTG